MLVNKQRGSPIYKCGLWVPKAFFLIFKYFPLSQAASSTLSTLLEQKAKNEFGVIRTTEDVRPFLQKYYNLDINNNTEISIVSGNHDKVPEVTSNIYLVYLH